MGRSSVDTCQASDTSERDGTRSSGLADEPMLLRARNSPGCPGKAIQRCLRLVGDVAVAIIAGRPDLTMDGDANSTSSEVR